MVRQQRLQINVARIEARDRAESEDTRRLNTTPPSEAVEAPLVDTKTTQQDRAKDKALQQPPQQHEQVKSPWKISTNPEPEAWSPRARKRGE